MTMRIGSHISSGGSFPASVREMDRLGGNCLQVFSRNPRGGRARKLGSSEVEEFASERTRLDVTPAVLHLPYTVNLASAKDGAREFGRRVVAEDLIRGALLGVEFLVMHPGSHGGQGLERGMELAAEGLRWARNWAEEGSPEGRLPDLVLENMAGSGTEVGGELEHLGEILELAGSPPWLRFCLDTAHAHGAGYRLWEPEDRENMMEGWRKSVGLDRLAMVHLNDSKVAAGSRRDRHQLLGQGEIGQAGLKPLLQHPNLKHLPFIIESPVEKQDDYAGEIRLSFQWAEEGSLGSDE